MAEQEAGWHNDPYGRFQQRYYNGTAWTEHVATGGQQQVDPLGASSVIPIATPPTAFATVPSKGAGVVEFLDSAGPDSRERPMASLRTAVAGLGGAILAIGAIAVVIGDNATRAKEIAVSIVVLAAAWANRMFVKQVEVQSAAVGAVVVAIPAFAAAATVSNGTSDTLTAFVMTVLFIAAWALPGFKSRNLLLALGAISLVTTLGSLASSGSDGSALPTLFTDNLGNQGFIYLLLGALYFGLTLWLDRRGYRGTATALASAGLVATLLGTVMLAGKFNENSAPLFVLAVGLVIATVGSRGARRATTWWGAVLTAIAAVWFVAVQWEPGSSVAIGGVLIVAGVALIGIPMVATAIRTGQQAQKSDAVPAPPAT